MKNLLSLLCVLAALTSCGLDSVADGDTVNHEEQSSSSRNAPQRSSSSNTSASSSSSSQTPVLPESYWAPIAAGNLERPASIVTLNAFQMARTEVTVALYARIMGAAPALAGTDSSWPVTHVSWFDAVRFCNALSKSLGLDTLYSYTSVGVGGILSGVALRRGISGIRLPTEAEWEYAYRAGTRTDFFWGDGMESSEVSRYLELFESGRTQGPLPVASHQPNPWGLYDMAGNAWEWLQDWYAPYDPLDTDNPEGPLDGSERCRRGGGWSSLLTDMRADSRFRRIPDYVADDLGFRVILVF